MFLPWEEVSRSEIRAWSALKAVGSPAHFISLATLPNANRAHCHTVTSRLPVTRSRGPFFQLARMLRTLPHLVLRARHRHISWSPKPTPLPDDHVDELTRATILDKVMKGRQPTDLVLRCPSLSLPFIFTFFSSHYRHYP